MKARKRFLLLFFIAFLAFIHFGLKLNLLKRNESKHKLDFFLLINERENQSLNGNNYYDFNKSFFEKKLKLKTNIHSNKCRMNSCFDFKRCQNGLKIHLYGGLKSDNNPIDGINANTMSANYYKILNFIRNSRFYEPNPQKACLFVTTLDTLDRDPLSRDFQKPNPQLVNEIKAFQAINGLEEGLNHVVFNLYSGSWPQYKELDFSGIDFFKKALLLKASQSYANYRPNFDISLPLFARTHPQNGPQFSSQESLQNYVPTISGTREQSSDSSGISSISEIQSKRRRNILVFKGKRYIYGIGSETRNSLFHLNNGKDIQIVTTCKHGKHWKDMTAKDDKCEKDNKRYEMFNYEELMGNSTFCLVPRGRRLGSFRFLEALQWGCIPVILSNEWVLPFSEVLDWNSAVILADERLLLQIPEILRSISDQKLHSMRSKCLSLYSSYFSSLESILLTTFSIIEERIERHFSKSLFLWNLVNPGLSGLTGSLHLFYPDFSQSLEDFPGYRVSGSPNTNNSEPEMGFTAILLISRPMLSTNILTKFLTKTLLKSQFVRKVLIIWTQMSGQSVPQSLKAIQSPKVEIIDRKMDSNLGQKFSIYSTIKTDAIFQLDFETNLTTEELDFAYLVWNSFQSRIIGFIARDHFFDSELNAFQYSSKWANQYSMVAMDSAIYHKYFHYLFRKHFFNSNSTAASVSHSLDFENNECLDMAFAFLVSHITREGPIKITQRKRSSRVGSSSSLPSFTTLREKRVCFSRLIQLFGYLPLIKSQIRLEPVLFKDNVSNLRKKYRKLEAITH